MCEFCHLEWVFFASLTSLPSLSIQETSNFNFEKKICNLACQLSGSIWIFITLHNVIGVIYKVN